MTTSPDWSYLVQQLHIRDLPRNTLTIEITESLPMTDLGAIVPRLRALLNLGVGVSLDDHGTGHASGERLGTIPVTELKLDRSLIQSDSRRTMRSLESAVGQAKERGLRIVAEGVETPAHLGGHGENEPKPRIDGWPRDAEAPCR